MFEERVYKDLISQDMAGDMELNTATKDTAALKFLFELVTDERLDPSQAKFLFSTHKDAFEGPFGDKLTQVIRSSLARQPELRGELLVNHITALIDIASSITGESVPAKKEESPFDAFRRMMENPSSEAPAATSTQAAATKPVLTEAPRPAIPVSQSVTYEHIYCLEDGVPVRMLAPYIQQKYNMTPEEYRTRWQLPDEYPMVSPSYEDGRQGYVDSVSKRMPGKASEIATHEQSGSEAGLEVGGAAVPPRPARPAVPIEKSIKHDAIVCLEDGSEHIMLKRYLKNKFNLTPEAYRERWGLPKTYPMNAKAYYEKRLPHLEKIAESRRVAKEKKTS
ncbi:MucR family transcriptional regulator [Komagataeibacter sp. FNDCR1]|nr:MucR family transcriptional regulator [Komagataeibacter sp. FNDCR1]